MNVNEEVRRLSATHEFLVRALMPLAEDKLDPKKIPEHYQDYYPIAREMFQKFAATSGITTGRELPAQTWPVVCLLADLQKQIDDIREYVSRIKKLPQRAKEPVEAGG